MLLELMIAFSMQFMSNPTYAINNQVGTFVEIVKTQYDPVVNQTYALLVVYQKDLPFQNPYLRWMQPRPFKGQPSKIDILKTIDHLDYVKVVGLNL